MIHFCRETALTQLQKKCILLEEEKAALALELEDLGTYNDNLMMSTQENEALLQRKVTYYQIVLGDAISQLSDCQSKLEFAEDRLRSERISQFKLQQQLHNITAQLRQSGHISAIERVDAVISKQATTSQSLTVRNSSNETKKPLILYKFLRFLGINL